MNALDRRRGGADDNEAQAGHLVAGSLNRRDRVHNGRDDDGSKLIVAFSENQRGKPGQGYPAARIGSLVRRLTPVECERLQSFPDGWTLTDGPSLARQPSYPHRIDGSCPPPDGPRYAAMGDAVTVNVLEWIGRRLLARASHDAERPARAARERNPMTDPNQQITVTATRESWEALTRISPLSEMTYTPEGIDAFEAFQAIQQALHGSGGPEAGT